MNRRKFMKQSLAAGVAASAALRLDAGEAFPEEVGRSVILPAKPAAVSLDLSKTVVMVVDMQNDFGSKGGMFDRAGLDISIIQRAVPPTAKVLAAAAGFTFKDRGMHQLKGVGETRLFALQTDVSRAVEDAP